MPCDPVKVPRGTVLLCSRGRRKFAPRCGVCKWRRATKLCDGHKPNDLGTCDKPLCSTCAITRPDPKKPDETLDFCSARHAATVPELGGADGEAVRR